jgi:mycothiol synthase
VNVEFSKGSTSRPATEGDVPAMVDLVAAAEEHDDGAVEIDPEDFVMGFGRVGFDPETDSVIVFDDDLLVGWAELYRGRAEIEVRPSHRGRGLGSALLTWAEARARASGLTEIDQTRSDGDPAAKDLFRARGYEPKWDSWILRIELDEPISPGAVPTEIVIRPFDHMQDERAAHRIWEDAISAVRGREPEPFDVWASQTIAHAGFTPALSRIALAGDEVVATLLAYDFPEAGEVWVGQVATRASHRRRGIAGALLREVFVAARAAGRTRCGLSTDSATGARGLYERNGMRVVRTYTRYSKPLS